MGNWVIPPPTRVIQFTAAWHYSKAAGESRFLSGREIYERPNQRTEPLILIYNKSARHCTLPKKSKYPLPITQKILVANGKSTTNKQMIINNLQPKSMGNQWATYYCKMSTKPLPRTNYLCTYLP